MKTPITKKDLLDDYDKVISLLLEAKELADGKTSECGYKHIQYALNEILGDYEFMANLVYRKKKKS